MKPPYILVLAVLIALTPIKAFAVDETPVELPFLEDVHAPAQEKFDILGMRVGMTENEISKIAGNEGFKI